MELIPAVDLLGGRVVRLHQGRYDAVTEYSADPADMARKFEQAGAKRLHVVDLDGARGGAPENVDAISAILSATRLKVQIGGGVRNEAVAERWFNAGAARVVLGTIVVKNPDEARCICERWPDRVVAAVDAREGKVSLEGWTEESDRSAQQVVDEVGTWPIAAVLYTNIMRDGTREGPDVEGTRALQDRIDAAVIASGGIGSMQHLLDLQRANIRATVCGRALYAGKIDLAEAYTALDRARA